MDLVLFGIQGSGKGTQSTEISKHCNLSVFETGARLRQISQEDSELGKKVKGIIESGNLVSTEVVMEIISDFLHTLAPNTSALFDGIPRSQDQKEQFDALMTREGREFKGLLIDLSEEEALHRLTTRRVCEKCKAVYPAFYDKDICEACGGNLVIRKDDTPDAIRTRLDTFTQKTMPVIEDYKAQDKMLIVDGKQSIEKVTVDIEEVLKPHFQWR
ncbi:MAG: nucleoside monophosphate kinase [Candidatus Gracilibacteria bacterium]